MPPEPPSDSSDSCLPCDGETIIVLSSDDSDEEVEPDHVVYTLLGQQEPADGSSSDEEEDNDVNVEEMPIPDFDNTVRSSDANSGNLLPAPRPSGSEELASIWNSSPPNNSLSLNAEKTAQIQAAMANFTLPPSAVPAWAVNIPEEQWKQGLLDQLQRGNLKSFKSSANCGNNNSN